MKNDQFNLAKKYPFIFEDNMISLRRVVNYLTIVSQFENDKSSLKNLGMENFKEDIKYIFRDIKEERRRKLKKINESI